MTYPKQSETLHVETLNDELCLYDWQRKEVHALNPTAAKVWQMCDGQTSPQQMATQLRPDLPNELDTARAEELVWISLRQLEKANLLTPESAAAVLKMAAQPVAAAVSQAGGRRGPGRDGFPDDPIDFSAESGCSPIGGDTHQHRLV